MDADHVGAPEKLVLVHALGPTFSCAFRGEVLAPGDRLHADGGANAGDLGAQVAKADDAERAPVKVEANSRLPTPAGTHGMELLAQMAGKRQHERDCEFRRGQTAAAAIAAGCATYRNVGVLGSRHIDRSVALAS